LGELEVVEIASNVYRSTDKAVVNPGQCGSCWAFSAVGTMESAYATAAGKLGSYAEQQLVDCDTTGGSQAGLQRRLQPIWNLLPWQTGIAADSAYPYTARDGSCRASSVSKTLSARAVSGHQSVGKNNAALQLQSALNTSPVSVTVDADNSWQLYRSKSCGVFGQINHTVIAVGYDTSADTFKICNSWGASSSESGYVRVSDSVSNPYCLYNAAPFVAQINADVTV